MSAGPELSLEELDQKDQDYRADLEHNQRPSNIIMLRMLPPNATANEVNLFFIRIFKGWLFLSPFLLTFKEMFVFTISVKADIARQMYTSRTYVSERWLKSHRCAGHRGKRPFSLDVDRSGRSSRSKASSRGRSV